MNPDLVSIIIFNQAHYTCACFGKEGQPIRFSESAQSFQSQISIAKLFSDETGTLWQFLVRLVNEKKQEYCGDQREQNHEPNVLRKRPQ